MDLHLPEWLPRSNTVNLLAGLFLLTALSAAAQRSVRGCITAYRWNSIALGLIALTVAAATGARAIAFAAVLVLAIKAVLIPALLGRFARGAVRAPGVQSADDVQSFLSIPAGLLVCGVLVVIGFSQTRTLFGSTGSILASCLPVAVSTLLVGLFLMVSRKQARLQIVGLVIVENAIFLAAVSLTYGMPLIVEMGVLLDLLAAVALFGLFVGRMEETHGDTDTTRLTSLKG